jgi:hypothetical protein
MPERRNGRPLSRRDEQAEQAALVEPGFRIANDRMTTWPERHSDGRVELYLCECSDLECQTQMRLGREQYEAARAHPEQFIVWPGHERPDFETVAEAHGSYLVVRTPESVRRIAVGADPRFTGIRDPFAAATALAREAIDGT